MSMYRPLFLRVALFLFTVALALAPSPLAASGQPEASLPPRTDPAGAPDPADLDAVIPFRDAIRTARLENGLELYTLEHPHPENTVYLRLIVDAGSVLETEPQRGLAHFVEHMAFNGTEEFGENELVAYLEGLGIRFGPDVNAYTSFDETVYKLELPANDPEALRTGFRVMQQWAAAVSFEEDAIERERGVVVEEWRGGRGASQRILDQHLPLLFGDSRYARRLPIGELDVIQNAPRSEFLNFYRRWYRPDNMALVAVGDLPAARLERLAREAMSGIEQPATPLDRPYFFVPEGAGTEVSVASDPEASRSTVAMYLLGSPPAQETVGDYRQLLVRALFSSVINERLRDIARDPQAPVTTAGIGHTRFLRGTDIAVASAVVRDHRPAEALELLARELERARRYGVLESELERARRRFLQTVEEARVNFSSRSSALLADELVRHWTEGEPVPGIDFEYRVYRELLPGISVSEVSAVADEFTQEEGRVILASLREDAQGQMPNGQPIPRSQQLLAAVSGVGNAQIAAPQDAEEGMQLLEQPPRRGAVVSERYFEAVDTHEFELANGMRVFVRSTDFSEDEVLVSAYSPGGLALVADGDVAAARLVAPVMEQSGLGGLDAAALERMLSGRSVSLSAGLGRVSESMSANSRQEDLPLLFEMMHAAFTRPRFGETALSNVQQQRLQQIAGARAAPQGRYSRRIQELFANGDGRLGPPDPAAIEAVTTADLERVYRDRFSDPADFSVVVVGSAAVETIRDLAEQYLASIPRPAAAVSDDDPVGFQESIPEGRYPRPEGIVADTVRAGSEPVAQLAMVLHGPYEWSRSENFRFTALASLLDTRLREEIREAAGGAYSVGAGGWRWRDPQPWAYMQLGFGLDPERVDELRSRAFEVIEELRTREVSSDYIERIKAQERDQYAESIRDNSYWLSILSFSVQHGRDLNRIPEYPELIESLTAADLLETARQYLNPDRRIELLLLPEQS